MSYRWIQQLRPHQWVHQLTVLIVVSKFGQAPLERLITAPFISLAGTFAFLLVGDYLHRDDDAEMGRDRLTQYFHPTLILGSLGVCLLTVSGFALFYGGLLCLAFIAAMMGGTLLYNIAKKKRSLWVSYSGRFIAGVALVGVYQSFLYNSIGLYDVVALGLCSGLLDVAGNLGGDLRDLKIDKRAKLKTLPIVYGTTATYGSVVILHTMAYILVSGSVQNVEGLWFLLVLWTSVGLWLASHGPHHWKHAALHGPKLMQLLWIGACIHSTSMKTLAIASSFIAMLWTLSYTSYLWSSKRMFSACNESRNAMFL